jgi:SOS-response transcriptional repressor LexA
MDQANEKPGLSERLTHVRQAAFGPRGRAAFARELGVSPSTYNYYEKGRPAPADLLAKAAQVTGADLTWLLTGAGEPYAASATASPDIGLSQPAQETVARFAASLAPSPQAAAAGAAFRALMGNVDATLPQGAKPWKPHPPQPGPNSVPIIGRTAAGILAAWEECFAGQDDPQIMERLLGHVEEGAAAHRREAVLTAADPQHDAAQPADATAWLTQLAAPTPEGITEFIDVPGLGPVEPGTFALRVDGNSMFPRLRDGDIIISNRRAEPQPGQTVLVKIRGHVGVTVKLWRPEGDTVHLIPVNEASRLTIWPKRDIAWACRVLYAVRL